MKNCLKENAGYMEYVTLFISLCILGALVVFHISYYSKISVWTNFRIIESYFAFYPYDSFFSAKCDMVFCLMKCIIAKEKNYVFYNNNKVDYTVTHETPADYLYREGYCAYELPDFLLNVKETVEFKRWYCGHHHKDTGYGRVRILYDDVIQIGENVAK